MNASLDETIGRAAAAIRERSSLVPRFAVTLGTGLGTITDSLEVDVRIPYPEIPGFPDPRVTSHEGALVLGRMGGRPVAVLEGRYHYYEGYSLAEITLPIRVARRLGVELAVFSNAVGGLNPLFRRGGIMLITDHINLMGVNPLVGPNDDRVGPRFPDMSQPYDRAATAHLASIALEEGIPIERGVYAALTGPSLETAAEYRYLRIIGADAVGMSTAPEVIAGVHCGLRCVGISCITDMCLPDALEPVDISEILRVAAETGPRISRIVGRFISSFAIE
jgi:purine-nucleoside phosphorylase